MSLESGLVSFLNAQASITGIVGTRIFNSVGPQDVDSPYLLFTLLGSDYEYDTSGQHPYATYEVQFDCCSREISHCVDVIDALRDLLSGASGALGSETLAFGRCMAEMQESIPPTDGSDRHLYRKAARYMLKMLA